MREAQTQHQPTQPEEIKKDKTDKKEPPEGGQTAQPPEAAGTGSSSRYEATATPDGDAASAKEDDAHMVEARKRAAEQLASARSSLVAAGLTSEEATKRLKVSVEEKNVDKEPAARPPQA